MTTAFDPPYPPKALDGHEALGDQWATELDFKARRDAFQQQLKGLYFAGIVLWEAHRKRLAERVEAGGGVKSVESGRGLNRLMLMDGAWIRASEILRTPPVVISSGMEKSTPRFFGRYTQARTLDIAFAGKSMGFNLRATDYEVDSTTIGPRLDKLLEDKTLFPEGIELRESVTTTHPGTDNDHTTGPPHVSIAHYALEGQIWGSNYAGENPSPDPFADYQAYKLWALQGNPQINTVFSAPRLDTESGHFSHPILIDRYGAFRAPGIEVVEHLDRFRERITFYAFQQYPDLFGGTDPETFAELPKIQAAIES